MNTSKYIKKIISLYKIKITASIVLLMMQIAVIVSIYIIHQVSIVWSALLPFGLGTVVYIMRCYKRICYLCILEKEHNSEDALSREWANSILKRMLENTLLGDNSFKPQDIISQSEEILKLKSNVNSE